MKRMSRYAMARRLVGLLLCALLLAGILPCFGALGATKKNNTGSLEVSLHTNIEDLPKNAKVEFTLYRIALPDQGAAIGVRFEDSLSDKKVIARILKAENDSALQDAANELAEIITTDSALRKKCLVKTLDLSSGSARVSNLAEGYYLGVLTEAPKGLTANASLFPIPSRDHETQELEYDRSMTLKDSYTKIEHDSVTVIKTESEYGTPLEGVEFGLYYGNMGDAPGDRPIATYVTDEHGSLTISTEDEALADILPSSSSEKVVMILRETKAPWGYILPRNDAYKVVITKDTSNEEAYNISIGSNLLDSIGILNYPIYGDDVYNHNSVTIDKVDNGNRPLNGAIFTLYYNNRAITTYSGGSFKISTEDKPLKRYLPEPGKKITLKLKETTAPSGYQRSDKEYDVVISANSTGVWNSDYSKKINSVTYYITIDGKTSLTVANEPVPTEPETPGGGGGGVPETPTPVVDITVTKNWVDDGNFNQVRPGAIDITLYADGSPVDAQPTWTRSGDSWTATFRNLPRVDGSGNEITYTVDESPVEFYRKDVSGLTITNTLEERPPQEYVDLSVTKIWQDNGNIEGRRPTNITIYLYRDDVLIETVHVTPGTDWLYTFKHLPADNGYGHVYTYTIDEETVPGYYKRVNGLEITNGLLPPDGDIPNQPDQPREIPERGGTPAPVFEDLTDEELEELFDMFGYGTPLYGMLGTGDEIPVWVWICGGVGIVALALAILMGRKRRQQ